MARYKLVESANEADVWWIYRRAWFWWHPIAVRSGFDRAGAFIDAMREQRC